MLTQMVALINEAAAPFSPRVQKRVCT